MVRTGLEDAIPQKPTFGRPVRPLWRPSRRRSALAFASCPCPEHPAEPWRRHVGRGVDRPVGRRLTVNQTSPRAIVNWGSFSIGQGNGVTFNQPNASSAILNRVTGSTTLDDRRASCRPTAKSISSTRTGSRSPGPAPFRSAAAFVASTLGIADSDFNNGNLNFVGNGASAGVSNAGSIDGRARRLRRPPRRHGVEFGRRLGAAGQGRDGLGRAGDAEPDRRQFSSGRRPDEHEDGRRPGADRRLRQGPRRGRIGAAQGGDGRAGDPQRGQRAGRTFGRLRRARAAARSFSAAAPAATSR